MPVIDNTPAIIQELGPNQQMLIGPQSAQIFRYGELIVTLPPIQGAYQAAPPLPYMPMLEGVELGVDLDNEVRIRGSAAVILSIPLPVPSLDELPLPSLQLKGLE